MKCRWHCYDLVVEPPLMGGTGSNPFSAFKLTWNHLWILFGRALDQKKPCVESARIEGRCYPAPDERKVISIKLQLVVSKKVGPRHSTRLEIIQQRLSLAFCQGLGATHHENPKLFKEFTGSATDHCRGCLVGGIPNFNRTVTGVDLATRKGMKTSEEGKTFTTFDPINFRVDRVAIIAQQNYGRSIFRRVRYRGYG